MHREEVHRCDFHRRDEGVRGRAPNVKKQIDERVAQLQQDFDEREKKLSRAFDAAQEALQL